MTGQDVKSVKSVLQKLFALLDFLQ